MYTYDFLTSISINWFYGKTFRKFTYTTRFATRKHVVRTTENFFHTLPPSFECLISSPSLTISITTRRTGNVVTWRCVNHCVTAFMNRAFCVLLSIVCEAQESHKKRVNLFFSEMYKSPLFYSRTRNLAGLYSSVFFNSDLFTYMSIRLLKIAQIKSQLSRLVSRAVLPKRPSKCFFMKQLFLNPLKEQQFFLYGKGQEHVQTCLGMI